MFQLYRFKIGSATPCGGSRVIATFSRPCARSFVGHRGSLAEGPVHNRGEICLSDRKQAGAVVIGENLRSYARPVLQLATA